MSCRRDAQPERAFHASPTGRVLNGVSKLRDRRYHQVFSALLLPTCAWQGVRTRARPACRPGAVCTHPMADRPFSLISLTSDRPCRAEWCGDLPLLGHEGELIGIGVWRAMCRLRPGAVARPSWAAPAQCPLGCVRPRPRRLLPRCRWRAGWPPSLAHVTAAHAGRSSGYRA